MKHREAKKWKLQNNGMGDRSHRKQAFLSEIVIQGKLIGNGAEVISEDGSELNETGKKASSYQVTESSTTNLNMIKINWNSVLYLKTAEIKI